jgi:lysozyme
MMPSEEIMHFVREQEGVRLEPYRDIAGNWTVGYGHRCDATQGAITLEEAEAFLQKDLTKAAQGVNDLIKVELNQRQFDALVSLLFNLGISGINRTHFLHFLQNSNFLEAAALWSQFCHSGNHVSSDLLSRRLLEVRLFLGEHPIKDYDSI